jgi:hypothetical protein
VCVNSNRVHLCVYALTAEAAPYVNNSDNVNLAADADEEIIEAR